MYEVGTSREERELIREHVPGLSAELRTKLAFTGSNKGWVSFLLTEEETEELLDGLSVAATEGDRKRRRKLTRLYEKVARQAPMVMGESPLPTENRVSGTITEKMRQALQEHPVADLDEANRIVQQIAENYNRTPQPDFDGLSPLQMCRLLYSDWDSPESAIVFNEALSLEELSSVEILVNARTFLQALRDEGGTKATAAGNLNRKFVAVISERLWSCDRFLDDLRRWKKTWNEEDVKPLEVLRHVLQFAGLIRKVKGVFRITKKGEKLLAAESAGALYILLFKTFFLKFNLAYFDGLPECPGAQQAFLYTLLMVARHAKTWTPLPALAEKAFTPSVSAEIPFSQYRGESNAPLLLWTRFVNPLLRFGMVQCRNEEERASRIWTQTVRKTPLFDTFVEFRLDGDPPVSHCPER